MEGSVGAPPQRVCPSCARISWATGPQCPYCTARFRRSRGVTPAQLIATAVGVVVVIAIMLLIFANQMENELNDRVDEVNAELDKNFNQIRTDVQNQLQQAGGGVPTAVPTPTVSPLDTTTPVPTETAAPTETATAAPTETATKSPTPSPTIGP
jgi:hypothetical protein